MIPTIGALVSLLAVLIMCKALSEHLKQIRNLQDRVFQLENQHSSVEHRKEEKPKVKPLPEKYRV